jgi:dTDP-4-amino-4,6-dideoxygalactose transaminase
VPVFADVISEDEPTIDPAEARRLIGPRTRAVVVMHYAGYPARVQEIVDLAGAHGIPVIEDAAHAPAVRHGGRALGTFADIGCFSFHATKNLTTGEGGMLVARDPGTLDRLRSLRSHCIVRPVSADRPLSGGADHDVADIGLNYRPTEVSAAIGRVQLGRLAADRARRTALVRHYNSLLATVPGLRIPFASYEGDAAHHLKPVLLPHGTSREAVSASLHEAGVQTSVHYRPTHQFTYYRQRHGASLPVTEAMTDRLLSLPLHARMTESDVDHVVDVLRHALKPTER